MTGDGTYTRSPLAHLEVDLDGVVLRANQASAGVFNRTAKDLVSKSFVDLFPPGPAGRETVQRILCARMADGEEVALSPGADPDRWTRLFAWPAHTTGDARQALQIILLDITEHRRLQLSLEESEARFRTLGDSAPVLLWMSGRDGRCTFFNQRWLEFTGRTLDDELGDGWAEGVHPEDFQDCMDTYLTAFVERRGFRMEYRLRRADGEYRWILDTGLPRSMPDGTFAGFIGSCIDVTDFREANDALRHLQRQLEGRIDEARKAIEVRDDFLSIAAHELRTPLSALVLQLSGLQGHLHGAKLGPLRGKMTGKIDRAVQATDRLNGLVDSLLDASRIAAGSLLLQPEACDLADVAQRVLDRFSDTARRAGCELRCRVAAPIDGVWDRHRLDQILENLLSNALKYGPGQPVEVTVTKTDEVVRLAVRDHGIGIAEKDLARIFARFERAVPSRHYGGLGLGLYITRQGVEAHGGVIRVKSEPGCGSTFEVELPRRPELGAAPH